MASCDSNGIDRQAGRSEKQAIQYYEFGFTNLHNHLHTDFPPIDCIKGDVQEARRRCRRSAMATSSPKKALPLFDSPSKYGVHPTIGAFTPTEQRFKWQATSNPTDAIYALPTSIGTGSKKSFGTSTREDWDLTRKNTNDNAGPGSYKSVGSCGRQPSSLCRNSSVTAFENASRSPLRGDATPSPGPIYELSTSIGLSPTSKFGHAKRQPLNGKSEGPGPNLMLPTAFKELKQGVSPTFGTEKRMRPGAGSAGTVPGPIYDLSPTGMHTGANLSFGKAKRF